MKKNEEKHVKWKSKDKEMKKKKRKKGRYS